MTTMEILPRFSSVRQTGEGQWAARCPAHEDRTASLSICAGDDGKTLVHCHAGCAVDAILGKVGLQKRDLFAHANGNGHAPTGKKEIVATYNYRDAQGDLLYQVVRFDPKDFRQRRPAEGGGWTWKLGDTRRVLYRLPELLAADPAATVFVVEGEKDCDRLRALGLVATCNVGGAGKWRQEYNAAFTGRRVAILPDNDTPGREHAAMLAAALRGTAASVKVVELPGLTEKQDASDWLNAGGTADGLQRLVDAATEWAPTEKQIAADTADDFPLTDTGLAERFAAQHRENVRYCYPWRAWLVYDGRRWNRNADAQVEQLAKQTIRSILREAADESDDDRRKALVKFARQSESAQHRAAMLRLAQSEPGIPILPDALDRDPWALNCPNGTLDLRSGELRPHRREDYLTKLCPVEYDPSATAPTWYATLDRCLGADYDLVDFVQRFVGHCLTGDVSEQVLVILHGVGANGKSTILNAIMAVMGSDYSMKAHADMLLVKRNSDHPTALTDLHGKRLAAAIETEEGNRLAENLVKELTGGDPIRARRMREDFWQFDPTHKVVLACNHKPIVRGTDHAIWRRIKLVPFNVIIPPAERDKHLPDRLGAEHPGILAWMVRGCLDWQRDGLGAPTAVVNATAEYQTAEDVLLNFIGECCVQGDAVVKASDLLAAFKEWSGDKYMTAKRFGRMLNERGLERYHNNGVWYRGIGLTTERTEGSGPFSG